MVTKFFKRSRVCEFCRSSAKAIDFSEIDTLRRYVDNRARIKNRRRTGVCAKHQRRLAKAIKIARQIALLPYK
ncbi:30S ribosomal protein S18 [Candidatus Aerophobetes bacterium]|nr:30S ribosomal protein S18 [Candidatus Aerophobetes bacterium]